MSQSNTFAQVGISLEAHLSSSVPTQNSKFVTLAEYTGFTGKSDQSDDALQPSDVMRFPSGNKNEMQATFIGDTSSAVRIFPTNFPLSYSGFTFPRTWQPARYRGRLAEEGKVKPILISTRHAYPMMPLKMNRHVQRMLNYYQHDIHDRFQRYLDRFAIYKTLVQREFRKVGLPTELGYLSLIESGFNTRAFSRASASGPWQFMKKTGRAYGLHVTWYVDERRDPVKSTVAAAQHLRDLFDQFQSWPLALGAYNAGGSKINRAIRKTGSRDFWKIRKTRYILRETKDYVPSFIAAALIASNPAEYGFTVKKTNAYAYHTALVHKRAHLKDVAKGTGISLKSLKELNPELLQNIVPIVEGGYSIKVPKGKGPLVRERHDRIQVWAKPPPVSATWYRVRFGDTLADIARQFGLTKQELRHLNNLKDDRIRWNDRLRLRTDDDSPPVVPEVEPSPPPTWYRVHFGDTLDDVAQQFGLTKRELRRLNNLEDDRLRWNSRLRVRAEEDNNPSLVPKTKPTPPPTWYRVHFGDTLQSVADEFGLSVQELKRLNNLRDDQLRWNTRLRVRAEEEDKPPLLPKPEPSLPPTWYRVHFGDTLDEVAKRFGLTKRELKRLNNLKDDRLRWNSRLRVRAEDAPKASPVSKSASSSPAWYRIRFGDTLSSIAQEFNLSVKELKRLNNLTNDFIRSNDRLRVRANDDNIPVALNSDKDHS